MDAFITPRPGSDRRTKNKLVIDGPRFEILKQEWRSEALGNKPGILVRSIAGRWTEWFRADWVLIAQTG